MAKKEYAINWTDVQEDTVYNVKNMSTLYLRDCVYGDLSCSINDKKQLIITYNEKNMTLSNYSRIKYIKTDFDGAKNIINEGKIINSNVITTNKNIKLKGTIYSDTILVGDYTLYNRDGSEKEDTNKSLKGLTISANSGNDDITATKYKDTINAGAGNDIIHSSLGNDSITGGAGTNQIIYSGFFDKDTITLTNKENLEIDLSAYDFEDGDSISYRVSGNNLAIDITNTDGKYGTIILKNFKKTNVVKSGSVKLFKTADKTSYTDLNTFNELAYTYDNFSKKGVFNGSRFSEEINATGLGRGATINGGAGFNIITVADGFNDKITGGNDGNFITAGSGNKTIKTGNGADVIEIGGDGTHKINAGNGMNNITVTGNGTASVTTGNGDDTITVDGNGTHTINAGNGKNTVIVAGGGTNTITTGSGKDKIIVYANSTTTIKAGNGENDISLVSTGKSTIKTGKHNDTITIAGSSSKTIYSGAGTNTINIDNNEKFGTITLKEENVSASNIILFSTDTAKNFIYSRNGKNLILEDFILGSKIIIEQYYSTNRKHSNYEFYFGGTKYELSDLVNSTKITDSGNISGTDGNDIIYSSSDGIPDTITAKKGDDTIKAGNSVNNLFFYEGDGNDTILNGGGTDTLIFAKDTNLSFVMDEDDLIISYGTKGDTITIKDYTQNPSVQYVQVGNNKTPISQYFNVLELGGTTNNIRISNDVSTHLELRNPYDDGKSYYYNLISTSESDENVFIKYLQNGRLYINGNNIKITASEGQNDDIILEGKENELYTKDGDDRLRLGHVIDANGHYYNIQSDKNIINMGDGEDYVTDFGCKNAIDMGNGSDKVMVMHNDIIISDEDITGAEEVRYYNKFADGVDYQVGWYNQGSYGGDCRLLSMLSGISEGKNFTSLEDYVTIEKVETGYSVTFKNYTSGNNTTIVTDDDLGDDDQYVWGDLDVALIDIAMNNLIYENGDEGKESVETADYNTLSEYMFGTKDTTLISNQNEFITKFNQLWTSYQNGEISNLSVGTPNTPPDFTLGIIDAHAYSVLNVTNDYVTLINPWDSADVLNLDITTFYKLGPCAIVYGTDYFDQNTEFIQGLESSTTDIDQLISEVTCWTNTQDSSNITEYTDNTLEQNPLQIFEYTDTYR